MARKPIRLLGLQEALIGLKNELKELKAVSKQGLIRAGLRIQREAQIEVPVDLANLRSSAYTVWSRTQKPPAKTFTGDEATKVSESFATAVAESLQMLPSPTGDKIAVIVGFGANYALYVHEGTLTEEGQVRTFGNPFLERALKQNRKAIIGEIEKHFKKDGY